MLSATASALLPRGQPPPSSAMGNSEGQRWPQIIPLPLEESRADEAFLSFERRRKTISRSIEPKKKRAFDVVDQLFLLGFFRYVQTLVFWLRKLLKICWTHKRERSPCPRHSIRIYVRHLLSTSALGVNRLRDSFAQNIIRATWSPPPPGTFSPYLLVLFKSRTPGETAASRRGLEGQKKRRRGTRCRCTVQG